ncbi:MAG TPA: TIGR03085 family metal-binding protein [Jatrophihabitantaceae bacterium]|nr:TIGR03085 family metal-binding protein [Jatrophihabitantaceae bacterium]
MDTHALDERNDLVESLRLAGPGAPTLIPEWTTSQLAAHLLLRERSFAELAGRVPVQRMRDYAQRHLDAYAATHEYEQVIADFAAGPPIWSPLARPRLREALNLLEYVIHNEDVRRAGQQWQPRAVPAKRVETIWARLRVGARMTMRSVPVPVQLAWPDHASATIGRGAPRVTVTGDPVELALVAFGRQRIAQVDYEGTDEDVTTVRDWPIAI